MEEEVALTIVYPIVFGFLSILFLFLNLLIEGRIRTYLSVMMASSLAVLGTTLFYSISSPVSGSPLMIFLTVISSGIFIVDLTIIIMKAFRIIL